VELRLDSVGRQPAHRYPVLMRLSLRPFLEHLARHGRLVGAGRNGDGLEPDVDGLGDAETEVFERQAHGSGHLLPRAVAESCCWDACGRHAGYFRDDQTLDEFAEGHAAHVTDLAQGRVVLGIEPELDVLAGEAHADTTYFESSLQTSGRKDDRGTGSAPSSRVAASISFAKSVEVRRRPVASCQRYMGLRPSLDASARRRAMSEMYVNTSTPLMLAMC